MDRGINIAMLKVKYISITPQNIYLLLLGNPFPYACTENH